MDFSMSSFELCSLIWLGLFNLYYCETIASSTCIENGPCSCTYQHGVEINLQGSEISKTKISGRNGSIEIIFQPCHNSSDIPLENECHNATALCLIMVSNITAKKRVADVARYSDFQFHTAERTGNVYLRSVYNNWTTSIQLQCFDDSSFSKINISSIDTANKTLNLVYKSPRVCLKTIANENKITFGSILMIIFLIFCAYFVFGCLTKLIFYGSQGCEMIPNYNFWSSVMNYIRDSVFFCARGFTSVNGYDQI